MHDNQITASGENPWQVDQESEMRGGEAPQASAQGAQGGAQGARKAPRKAGHEQKFKVSLFPLKQGQKQTNLPLTRYARYSCEWDRAAKPFKTNMENISLLGRGLGLGLATSVPGLANRNKCWDLGTWRSGPTLRDITTKHLVRETQRRSKSSANFSVKSKPGMHPEGLPLLPLVTILPCNAP